MTSLRRPADDPGHDDFGGLARDLPGLLSRRRALRLLGGVGLALLAGCGADDEATPEASGDAPPSGDPPAGGTTAAPVPGARIPAETAGPYAGDGSNGPNVLAGRDVVRRDIRKSIGSGSGTAEGVPLTVELRVVDVGAHGRPLEGAAVYVWHCTRDGEYSMYSPGVSAANYLRGVQIADADGWVTFDTIFPGAYPGRWPHIHFEVYQDEDTALSGGPRMRTSQLALPEDACRAAYAADGYGPSMRNLTGTSLSADGVFSDGYSLQLAKVTGDSTAGYTAQLVVAV